MSPKKKRGRRAAPAKPDWKGNPVIILVGVFAGLIKPTLEAQGVAVNLALSAVLWGVLWLTIVYVAWHSRLSRLLRLIVVVASAVILWGVWAFVRAPQPPPLVIVGYAVRPPIVGERLKVEGKARVMIPKATLSRSDSIAVVTSGGNIAELTESVWKSRPFTDSCWPDCAQPVPNGEWFFSVEGPVMTPQFVSDFLERRAYIYYAGQVRYGPGNSDILEMCVFFGAGKEGAILCPSHNGPP